MSNISNFTSGDEDNSNISEEAITTNILEHRPPSLVHPRAAASLESVVALSALLCAIEVLGIVGNLLVIVVVVADKKMRRSPTNMFIMNLSVGDLLIMIFGVPEIVQFMLNRGWLLGPTMCRVERFALVCSLYASIMTLMSVCVERYIATVYPIQAHIICSRRHTLLAIGVIWPLSGLFALPTLLFNALRRPAPSVPLTLCLIHFPGDHVTGSTVYRASEFVVFFLVPVVVQIALYCVVGRRLFVGTADLHRRKPPRGVAAEDGVDRNRKQRDPEAIRSRRGVVRMLMASVAVYVVSYAPAQLPLFYDLVADRPFRGNWAFVVLLMTLSSANSAANPVLYAAFSQNFRRRFRRALCPCRRRNRSRLGLRRGRDEAVDQRRDGTRSQQKTVNMSMESIHPNARARILLTTTAKSSAAADYEV